MKTLFPAFGIFLIGVASSAQAAESGSRTYADPSCSERTAKPENCVIQDGPARRGTVGLSADAPATPSPTKPATGEAGKGASMFTGKTGSK